jgi:zinc protease
MRGTPRLDRSIPRLALIVVTAAAPVALGAQEPAPVRLVIPYTQFALPNGLRVILHEDHRVPVVSVNVWYHVGSGRETPGRTGFAHLFEHLMFEGSGHVAEGDFDNLLEGAGGDNNGSTNTDRTNYYITAPSNALELALFLESDRMGYLLDAMSPARVDGQRDVVKNERRQGVDNAPYGKVNDELPALLYPAGHPYSWDTIGSMDDLSAASYEDVVAFFKTFYVPGNASLVIAGDIDPGKTRALVERWFSDVPAGPEPPPIDPPAAALSGVVRKTITDAVQLPRLHLAWLTPPRYAPGDAELDVVATVLAGGKSSRLYERLVYDLQIAQDVSASQQSAAFGSVFGIVVTARQIDGVSHGDAVKRIQDLVDEEIARLRGEPPSDRELQRAVNQIEAAFFDLLENLTAKADRLNGYLTETGNPDFANEDLSRYRALDPRDVQAAAIAHLRADRRVELVVAPAPADPR